MNNKLNVLQLCLAQKSFKIWHWPDLTLTCRAMQCSVCTVHSSDEGYTKQEPNIEKLSFEMHTQPDRSVQCRCWDALHTILISPLLHCKCTPVPWHFHYVQSQRALDYKLFLKCSFTILLPRRYEGCISPSKALSSNT